MYRTFLIGCTSNAPTNFAAITLIVINCYTYFNLIKDYFHITQFQIGINQHDVLNIPTNTKHCYFSVFTFRPFIKDNKKNSTKLRRTATVLLSYLFSYLFLILQNAFSVKEFNCVCITRFFIQHARCFHCIQQLRIMFTDLQKKYKLYLPSSFCVHFIRIFSLHSNQLNFIRSNITLFIPVL